MKHEIFVRSVSSVKVNSVTKIVLRFRANVISLHGNITAIR